MAQRDSALDAFDQLRVREVRAEYDDTASTFLARFQSTAATLESDERVELVVSYEHRSLELLKAVLAAPLASKICSLRWEYRWEEDVHSVVPLLTSNCPELASLRVDFKHQFAFDFLSGVLEHPGSKAKILEIPPSTKGDLPRFFSALGRSQVSELTLSGDGSPEFAQGFCDYLAKDLLVRLTLWGRSQVPLKVMMSLANCTRLAELAMLWCTFSQPAAFTHLSKSITRLVLYNCTFVRGFDWSFLLGSNVQKLDLKSGENVDGSQLGSALVVHLRAKGLDELRFYNCDFVNETLAGVGVELGRIKRLDFDRNLNVASVELIALALQSPSSETKELRLKYVGVENHVVPALKHPNCHLAKLSLWTNRPEHKAAAKAVEDRFYKRLRLFALLQGQRVRKQYCPLRRLPVEMFRLVGEVLL